MKHRVDLRFLKVEVLEKLLECDRFVEGQAQRIDLMCHRQDDFEPELATTECTWNDTVLSIGSPIDTISNPKCLTVFDADDRLNM